MKNGRDMIMMRILMRPLSNPKLYNVNTRSWDIDITDDEIKGWFIQNVHGPIGSPELFDFYDTIPGRWAFIHNNYGRQPWPGDCYAFETLEQVLIMKGTFQCETVQWENIWDYLERWFIDENGRRFSIKGKCLR